LSTQFGIAPAMKATVEHTVVEAPSMNTSANTTALVAAAMIDPMV
jgi:hypothetical protein